MYFVVFQIDHDLSRTHVYYNICQMLKCIPCEVSDIDYLYQKEVTPLFNSGANLTTMVIVREPDNPFRESAEKPDGWLPGD